MSRGFLSVIALLGCSNSALGALSCEPVPPGCWVCDHPVIDGTTYAWWAQPFGVMTVEFSPDTPWTASVHCVNNNGQSATVYGDKQQPTPSSVHWKRLTCDTFT